MDKKQLSAQELRRSAEKEKTGKKSYGSGRTSAQVTVCDLITLLTAGGELIQVNKVRGVRSVKDYLHFVKYQGY